MYTMPPSSDEGVAIIAGGGGGGGIGGGGGGGGDAETEAAQALADAKREARAASFAPVDGPTERELEAFCRRGDMQFAAAMGGQCNRCGRYASHNFEPRPGVGATAPDLQSIEDYRNTLQHYALPDIRDHWRSGDCQVDAAGAELRWYRYKAHTLRAAAKAAAAAAEAAAKQCAAAGCGFYGNPDTLMLCSGCYKDADKRAAAEAAVARAQRPKVKSATKTGARP